MYCLQCTGVLICATKYRRMCFVTSSHQTAFMAPKSYSKVLSAAGKPGHLCDNGDPTNQGHVLFLLSSLRVDWRLSQMATSHLRYPSSPRFSSTHRLDFSNWGILRSITYSSATKKHKYIYIYRPANKSLGFAFLLAALDSKSSSVSLNITIDLLILPSVSAFSEENKLWEP